MDENVKQKIIDGLADFPVGIITHENFNANDIIIARSSIVLYLSDVYGLGVDKHSLVENALLNALEIKSIPNIEMVQTAFKLPKGFLQDSARIKQIKDNNKSFDKMYSILDEAINNEFTIGKNK